ncbi:MAG: HEPN domain-containing protein [Bacteroidales bacterium]|nr:HEPN domain-containing protein [Bacteroidales bacterium]
MNKEQIDTDKIIRHWIESSDNDYKTMMNLFSSKDYNWSLFIGHLVIEKLIKAFYVKENKKHPIPIHDLLRLSTKAKLKVKPEYEDFLDTITTFNINARYDTYKQEFYKLCTKDFAEKWINNIKELRQWIKKQLTK